MLIFIITVQLYIAFITMWDTGNPIFSGPTKLQRPPTATSVKDLENFEFANDKAMTCLPFSIIVCTSFFNLAEHHVIVNAHKPEVDNCILCNMVPHLLLAQCWFMYSVCVFKYFKGMIRLLGEGQYNHMWQWMKYNTKYYCVCLRTCVFIQHVYVCVLLWRLRKH